MTAKEMFEELGFKQTLCINEDYEEYAQIEYECCFDEYTKRRVYFVDKGFYANLYNYDFEIEKMVNVGGCIVDKDLLKAIMQQMKELGWIQDQTEKLEIKSDGLKTELFIDGVKQEKLNYIVYTHIAGNDPILTTSKEVRFISDKEKDNHE